MSSKSKGGQVGVYLRHPKSISKTKGDKKKSGQDGRRIPWLDMGKKESK